MKTHPSPDRLSLHADRIWVGRTGSKLCSSQLETRLSHRLTQKVFDFADLHVVKQRAFAVYLRATILALQEPARVPPPRSSCLDKHVGADGVNGDSREQAGAPREPRAADLGLGMQIGQEAALPRGPRHQRRSPCWAQRDATPGCSGHGTRRRCPRSGRHRACVRTSIKQACNPRLGKDQHLQQVSSSARSPKRRKGEAEW